LRPVQEHHRNRSTNRETPAHRSDVEPAHSQPLWDHRINRDPTDPGQHVGGIRGQECFPRLIEPHCPGRPILGKSVKETITLGASLGLQPAELGRERTPYLLDRYVGATGIHKSDATNSGSM
jgi:hypothetical protein